MRLTGKASEHCLIDIDSCLEAFLLNLFYYFSNLNFPLISNNTTIIHYVYLVKPIIENVSTDLKESDGWSYTFHIEEGYKLLNHIYVQALGDDGLSIDSKSIHIVSE